MMRKKLGFMQIRMIYVQLLFGYEAKDNQIMYFGFRTLFVCDNRQFKV